jgi:hypothetical protein
MITAELGVFIFFMTFMGVFLRFLSFRATCNDPRQERHETQALNPAEHAKKAESISLLKKQRRARWLVKEINFVSVRKQRWKPLARSAVAAQLRKAFFSLQPFTAPPHFLYPSVYARPHLGAKRPFQNMAMRTKME